MIPAPRWLCMLELFVMLCPQGHMWDVERRHYLHRSLWLSQTLCRDMALLFLKLSRKMWKFTLSEGRQWTQGSVYRYLWLINIMYIFEGLLYCKQISPEALDDLDIVSQLTVPLSLKENWVMFMKPDLVRLFCCNSKTIYFCENKLQRLFGTFHHHRLDF